MNTVALRERLVHAMRERVFPGAVLGIIDRNGKRTFLSVGRFTYDANSPEVREDTVYDVASITKSVPLALTALACIQQGRLGLDEPIIKYLPEIEVKHADEGLIRHLLTHTYTLEKNSDPNFSYEHMHAKDIFDFLYTRPLAFPPGTQYRYSNTPANLLGLILERISGKKLHVLAQELILDPLEMIHTTFHPTDKTLVPPTEIISWRGNIQGEVHDETAFILEREGFDPGCAGLFSDVGDLLNVAEMFFHKGVFRGTRLFDSKIITLMTTNALANIGESSSVGWELNQSRFMGKYTHEHMIGRTGFTGTSIVIDPVRGLATALLSNRTYPKRGETDSINVLRSDISDIVFGTV